MAESSPTAHSPLGMEKLSQTHNKSHDSADVDTEQHAGFPSQKPASKKSVYEGLGWLDRLLVVWILLAIIIGILLGNFVPSVGPALQRGKFVQVSVPIGMLRSLSLYCKVPIANDNTLQRWVCLS